MSVWMLRLRALVDRWFPLFVVAVLLMGLVGGWVTYRAHVDTPTRSEERVVSVWEMDGSIDHAATVENPNPVFPVGSRLENRQAYFTSIAPTLNGTVELGYRATGDGNVTVDVTTRAVLRGAERFGSDQSDGADATWRDSRPLASRVASRVASGETVAVPFSVNVTRLRAWRRNVIGSLGIAPSQVEMLIEVTVGIEGRINGQTVARTGTHELSIEVGDSTYRITEPGSMTERHEETRTGAVPAEYGAVREAGGPVGLLLSILLLGALIVGRRRGAIGITDSQREYLQFRDQRSEYGEWITSLHLPESVSERPRAEAGSLVDLVDLAINADTSVVEAPDESAYYVVLEEYVCVYVPPRAGTPTHDWPEEND